MILQIFGTTKSSDTKKAERFFKERGINIQFINLNEKKISKGELENIINSIPAEDIIDKECFEYKKKNFRYMSFDPKELILENPLIVKMPVVRYNNKATAGYCPDVWKSWF